MLVDIFYQFFCLFFKFTTNPNNIIQKICPTKNNIFQSNNIFMNYVKNLGKKLNLLKIQRKITLKCMQMNLSLNLFIIMFYIRI